MSSVLAAKAAILRCSIEAYAFRSSCGPPQTLPPIASPWWLKCMSVNPCFTMPCRLHKDLAHSWWLRTWCFNHMTRTRDARHGLAKDMGITFNKSHFGLWGQVAIFHLCQALLSLVHAKISLITVFGTKRKKGFMQNKYSSYYPPHQLHSSLTSLWQTCFPSQFMGSRFHLGISCSPLPLTFLLL